MNVLDWSKRHQRFFEEISRIPHGSYHEKPISDYFVSFAESHGFQYIRDEFNNVIIYKPASAGYENHAPVALQCHMDMVWEKDEGYEHDFMTEPLKLIVNGNILTAEHTTLGIDDGSGIAYILAILDDSDAMHPPIQAIFTVQEEVGMLGAQKMDKSVITANRFIGLDCGGGDCIYVSSLGGKGFNASLPVNYEICNGNTWQISISGLNGGYSTSYLSGAENAIEMLYELMDALNERFGIRVCSLEGGKEGGKVASEARGVFALDASETELMHYWEQLTEMIKKDSCTAESDVKFELVPALTDTMLSEKSSGEVLNLLGRIPCGAVQYNGHNRDLIGAVINLTEIKIINNMLKLHGTLRAESNRKLDAWTRRLKHIGGGEVSIIIEKGFPAWEYDPNSKMVSTLKKVFHDVTGDELGSEEVQGGIECSIFMQADRKIDMVTLGPFGDKVHTTDEYADLYSYDRIYKVFTAYLAAL